MGKTSRRLFLLLMMTRTTPTHPDRESLALLLSPRTTAEPRHETREEAANPINQGCTKGCEGKGREGKGEPMHASSKAPKRLAQKTKGLPNIHEPETPMLPCDAKRNPQLHLPISQKFGVCAIHFPPARRTPQARRCPRLHRLRLRPPLPMPTP